jgi:hypothetical protein
MIDVATEEGPPFALQDGDTLWQVVLTGLDDKPYPRIVKTDLAAVPTP